jgi:hypothetical protein
MKQSSLAYDLVYFMHLKGSSLAEEYKAINESGREVEFNVLEIFLDIFKNCEKIERIFKSNLKIGKSSTALSDVISGLMKFKLPRFLLTYTLIRFMLFGDRQYTM